MKISPRKWLTCFQARPAAAFNLILFPFGGGGASAYRELALQLPAHIQAWAVQLPGRESRFAEPFCCDPLTVVRAVADEIDALQLPNPVFFGHSMGSDLAVLSVFQRRQQGLPLPPVLMVSGNKPPSEPLVRRLADASTADLLQQLRSFGGIPAQALADPEFTELYLQKIRADYRLYEAVGAVMPPPQALDLQLLVVNGADDPLLQDVDLQQWQQYSRHPVTFHTLGHGHFYLQSTAAELAQLLARHLDAATRRSVYQ